MDDPLPENVRLQPQTDWTKVYNYTPEPYLDPADSLKGRIWREFKRQTASVVLAKQMKSVLCVTTAGRHESVMLPGNVKLTFDSENNLVVSSVIDYYYCLRTLSVAWSFCGNYMVTCSSDKASRRMMELTTAIAYADSCLRAVTEFGAGSLDWLTRVDQLTRGRMCTLIRQGWSADAALKEAQRIHQLDWRSQSPQQFPARQVETARPRTRDASPRPSKKRPRSPPARNAVKSDPWKTYSQAKGGKRLCKPYNDVRGCTDRNCQDLHSCDVRQKDGSMCGSKKHTRQQHKEH